MEPYNVKQVAKPVRTAYIDKLLASPLRHNVRRHLAILRRAPKVCEHTWPSNCNRVIAGDHRMGCPRSPNRVNYGRKPTLPLKNPSKMNYFDQKCLNHTCFLHFCCSTHTTARQESASQPGARMQRGSSCQRGASRPARSHTASQTPTYLPIYLPTYYHPSHSLASQPTDLPNYLLTLLSSYLPLSYHPTSLLSCPSTCLPT